MAENMKYEEKKMGNMNIENKIYENINFNLQAHG